MRLALEGGRGVYHTRHLGLTLGQATYYLNIVPFAYCGLKRPVFKANLYMKRIVFLTNTNLKKEEGK